MPLSDRTIVARIFVRLVHAAFFILAILSQSFAPVNLAMIRSTFTGAYVEITTAGGATALSYSNKDDGTVSRSLPFSFTYGNTTWTTSNYLAICTNGYAFFSSTSVTTPVTSANSILYSSTAPNNTLAPWLDDISVAAVGSNPQGQVLYQTTGVAGSRVLTVQWTNVSSWYETVGGQPRAINFQVKLFEGTNVVEFHYGPATGAASNTNESASIGLETGIGGPGEYIDAITGSKTVGNGMMTTDKWPLRFFRFEPGGPALLAGGVHTVGAGGDYPSLSEAVADVNHRGVAASITLSLLDAQYDSAGNAFPILIGPVANLASTRTLTIEPASGRAVLLSRGAAIGTCVCDAFMSAITTSNEPVIALLGSRYVTVRGLDLRTTGNALVDRGVLVVNSSGTRGATNNTIEDVSVRLYGGSSTTIGIQQSLITAPTLFSGTNDDNTYRNLVIEDVYRGIDLNGDPVMPDERCRLIGDNGQQTIVGGPTPGDIGYGGSADVYGVRLYSQSDVEVSRCVIRNLSAASSARASGLWCADSGTNTTSLEEGRIFANQVHDINVTAGIATGLRLGTTANSSSVLRVFNNIIYGLSSTSNITSGRKIIGISLQDAGGGAGAKLYVDFNSVRLAPAGKLCSNACLETATTTGPAIYVRNNILANFTGPQTGSARHFCWVTPTAYAIGPAGSVSDRNVLHRASTTNGYTGLSETILRARLEDWGGVTPGLDVASQICDPNFVTAADLHLSPGGVTPAEGLGSFFGGDISWATEDIDGDVRNASTPDAGADEGEFLPVTGLDLAAVDLLNPLTAVDQIEGVPFVPAGRCANLGATIANPIVRCRITGPDPAVTEIYNETVMPAFITACDTITVMFPAATIAEPGSYTIRLTSELPGDDTPANDETSTTFTVAASLNGVYAVGSGEAPPFHSLTTALARLGVVGVSGPVVFELVDSVYTQPVELFPIVLRPYPKAAAERPFTIRPAAAGHAEVRSTPGHSATAVFKLEGADYVTLDGGPGRDLVLTASNNSNFIGSVIWLSSQGIDAGCHHNTVRNCRIRSLNNQLDPLADIIGILSAGATYGTDQDGQDNDDNLFENNVVTMVSRGIHIRGTSGNRNNNTIVRNNIIGSEGFDAERVSRSGITLLHQNQALVTGNEIRFVGFDQAQGGGLNRVGIALGDPAWPITAPLSCSNTTVIGNLVHDISDQDTRAAVGVLAAAGPGNVIANNMIYGIVSNGQGGRQAVGIGIDGNPDGLVVAFNSIRLAGDMDGAGSATATQSACGVRVGAGGAANLLFVDNAIHVEVVSNAISLKHHAVVFPSGAFTFGSGDMDHNDYFADGTQALLGGLGTAVPYTGVTTLADWRTAFGNTRDAASLDVRPPFLTPSDLHLDPQASTPLRAAAEPLAQVTNDFDGDSRHASMPDIGADEVDWPIPAATVDDVTAPEGNAGFTPFDFQVRLTFPAEDTVRISWTTAAGTAAADTDFVSAAGLITLAPGDTESVVSILIVGDTMMESDETFFVAFSAVSGVAIPDSQAAGTIEDDDAVSTVPATGTPPNSFLAPGSPNPFRAVTMIRFGIARPSLVRLTAFDVQGRVVRSWREEAYGAGEHQIIWDGRDDRGSEVPAGVYFVRLQAGTEVFTVSLRRTG